VSNQSKQKPQNKITIRVDRQVIHVEVAMLTGLGIRQLVTPPIGPDRDLFLVHPGPAEDEPIADDREVELKSGMEFFSAPTTINPGSHAPRD
jgi:hypothetical protein